MAAESHGIRGDSALGRLIGALARTPVSPHEDGAVSYPARVYTYPPDRRDPQEEGPPTAASSAIALISVRIRAGDLASVLGSVLGGLLDVEVAVYHLGRSRDLALDLAQELADADAGPAGLARDMGSPGGLEGAIGQAGAKTRAVTIARTLVGELNAALNITRSLGALRDPELARELDRLVTRSGLLADALLRDIRQITVDACGVSLADVIVTDPEVLAGVLWNAATRWPPNLADWVLGHSDEVGGGRYQVSGASSRQDADPAWS
jgi:hypothetical protein